MASALDEGVGRPASSAEFPIRNGDSDEYRVAPDGVANCAYGYQSQKECQGCLNGLVHGLSMSPQHTPFIAQPDNYQGLRRADQTCLHAHEVVVMVGASSKGGNDLAVDLLSVALEVLLQER